MLICNSYFNVNVNVKKHTNDIFKVSSAFFCLNNESKRENVIVKGEKNSKVKNAGMGRRSN